MLRKPHKVGEQNLAQKAVGQRSGIAGTVLREGNGQRSARVGMCGFYCCFLQGKPKPLSRAPSCGLSYPQASVLPMAGFFHCPLLGLLRHFQTQEAFVGATSFAALKGGPGVPWLCPQYLELILISSWDALMPSLPRASMS